MGVATFPTYTQGSTVNYHNGTRTTYSGRIPISEPVAAAVIQRLDYMANQVPLNALYKASKADQWDAMTFRAGWIRKWSAPVPRNW